MTTKLVNKQLLGEIGESIQSSEFTNIKNLNDLIQHNFPIFDLIADKGNDKYIFSVKARYKYGQNGKINHIYNILHNTSTSSVASKYIQIMINEYVNPLIALSNNKLEKYDGKNDYRIEYTSVDIPDIINFK